MPDRNELRRKQYASDASVAEGKKQASRDQYRKDHPGPVLKSNGALSTAGTLREVYVEGMDHPETAETFTISEAARALNRTELTLRKWIEDDMLPDPILSDTVRGAKLYSAGELQTIARVLLDHEREYSYYRRDHLQTRTIMHQMVHGYRMQHI